jgi:hypothetical protein
MATEQTFSCPSCAEAFPSFTQLKSHMYHEHGRTVSKAILYGAPRPVAETKWFTCDHCGEKFRGRSNYDAHIRDMLQGAQARREAAERWEQRRREQQRVEVEEHQRRMSPGPRALDIGPAQGLPNATKPVMDGGSWLIVGVLSAAAVKFVADQLTKK